MAAAGNKSEDKRIPLLESISAGIGLAILAGMLGLLTYQALETPPGDPPVLVAEPVGLARAAGTYVMEVKVTNHSRNTGAGVQVEGVLKKGGSEIEKSNTTFDYVPGLSETHGGLVFTEDPRQHQLELRVTGYQRP